MKAKFFIGWALLIGLITTAGVPPSKTSQLKVAGKKVSPVFNSMRVHRQGKGATVAWSSQSTPSTVNCFTVIRTYEDPYDPYSEWTPVGTTACNSSRNYKHTESPVSPGFISYRVVADMANGGYEFSDIETLHIVRH
jgi:hypothetical protein